MKYLPVFFLSLITASLSFADDHQTDAAPYFAADKVMTLQGKLEAANRYDQTDFNVFNAGNGFVVEQSESNFTQGANVTLKGIACFDLEQNGMRASIAKPGSNRLILSFALEQIKGQPRPLRVEFVGTYDDISQSASLSKIFEAQPVTQVNNVLQRSTANGLKMADFTSLCSQSLEKRWLVIRFEQEGLRKENTGEDDLYQFKPAADTVRLTLSAKDAHGTTVGQHYKSSGYYDLTTDMPGNLLGDMPQNLTSDMPKDLTSDMPSDLTSDMPSNLIQDEPDNLIQDGNQ